MGHDAHKPIWPVLGRFRRASGTNSRHVRSPQSVRNMPVQPMSIEVCPRSTSPQLGQRGRQSIHEH